MSPCRDLILPWPGWAACRAGHVTGAQAWLLMTPSSNGQPEPCGLSHTCLRLVVLQHVWEASSWLLSAAALRS